MIEAGLDVRDSRYLLQAMRWSATARERGNRPLGALLVKLVA